MAIRYALGSRHTRSWPVKKNADEPYVRLRPYRTIYQKIGHSWLTLNEMFPIDHQSADGVNFYPGQPIYDRNTKTALPRSGYVIRSDDPYNPRLRGEEPIGRGLAKYFPRIAEYEPDYPYTVGHNQILYPQPDTINFYRVYGERVQDFKATIKLLNDIRQSILQGNELAEARLNGLAQIQPVLYREPKTNKTTQGFGMSSLLALIAYCLLQSLSGDYDPRLCGLDGCGTWFIARPKNKKFCSKQHQDAYNNRKRSGRVI